MISNDSSKTINGGVMEERGWKRVQKIISGLGNFRVFPLNFVVVPTLLGFGNSNVYKG